METWSQLLVFRRTHSVMIVLVMFLLSSHEALAEPTSKFETVSTTPGGSSKTRNANNPPAEPIRPLATLRPEQPQPQSEWFNTGWLVPLGLGLLIVVVIFTAVIVVTNSPSTGADTINLHKTTGQKALAIGSVALAILVVGGVAFYLQYENGTSDADMLACLPGDTTFIVGVDYEQLMAVDSVRERIDRNKSNRYLRTELIYKAGLTEYDVSKCLAGADDSYFNSGVLVLRFKKSLDQMKINSAMGASERSLDGKTYFKWLSGYAHYPKSDLLVLADTEALIKKVLANDGKVVLDNNLQEIATRSLASGIWFAGMSNPIAELSNHNFRAPSAAGAGQLPEFVTSFKSAKAFGVQTTIDNSQVKVRAMVKYSSADDASTVSGLANTLMPLAIQQFDSAVSKSGKRTPEIVAADASLRDFLNSLAVTANGEMLEASGVLKYDNLRELLRRANSLGSGPNMTFTYDPKTRRTTVAETK